MAPRPAAATFASRPAAAPAPAAPKVRAQAPEEPAPVRAAALVLPPPEALGLATAPAAPPAAAPAGADWSAARARLSALGAVGFQLQRDGDGYNFLVWLPTDRPGTTHRIESRAASEAEAVRLALDRADRWLGER